MSAIHTRDGLITALSHAAELEHLLCCSYLYTGFSLKKTPDSGLSEVDTETTRKWATSIMLIARQEMEHLGLVCNLMSAIGAGPDFFRPNFPQSAHYFPLNIPLELLPFGDEALAQFIAFEKPHWPQTQQLDDEQPQSMDHDEVPPYSSLQGLYDFIKQGFNNIDPATLFIGPTSAQITNETLFAQTEPGYQVNLSGITAEDPQEKLKQAQDIIDQIIAEGEGAIDNIEGSHYGRFLAIHSEYNAIKAQNPAFVPAYNVARNPQTMRHPTGAPGTKITDPFTNSVADLFNLVYEAMMLMLIRFYAQTDETADELSALEKVAFFPMMTMGIRPLGEVLTQLPAGSGTPGVMAGPTFEVSRPLQFLPHKEAAWIVLYEMLDRMGKEATELAKTAVAMNSPVAERLQFISMSFVRNAKNFHDFIYGTEGS